MAENMRILILLSLLVYYVLIVPAGCGSVAIRFPSPPPSSLFGSAVACFMVLPAVALLLFRTACLLRSRPASIEPCFFVGWGSAFPIPRPRLVLIRSASLCVLTRSGASSGVGTLSRPLYRVRLRVLASYGAPCGRDFNYFALPRVFQPLRPDFFLFAPLRSAS